MKVITSIILNIALSTPIWKRSIASSSQSFIKSSSIFFDKPPEYFCGSNNQPDKCNNTMPVDLYYASWSPPCRTVLLVAEALNVPLNLHTMDLGSAQHLTSEYIKLNPQHKIPTLVDDGFSLGESRAIIRYLANAYGGDTSLYPKDPKARALVDARLDFDLGSLYPSVQGYGSEQHLKTLNTFLGRSKYVAGEDLTIADYAIAVTVSWLKQKVKIDSISYPNVARWYKLLKSSGINL